MERAGDPFQDRKTCNEGSTKEIHARRKIQELASKDNLKGEVSYERNIDGGSTGR